MTGLPYDAALLEEIHRAHQRGGVPRPLKTPARDRLQRLGLIETAKPSLSRSIIKPYWRPTPKGRQEAENNRKEGLT